MFRNEAENGELKVERAKWYSNWSEDVRAKSEGDSGDANRA